MEGPGSSDKNAGGAGGGLRGGVLSLEYKALGSIPAWQKKRGGGPSTRGGVGERSGDIVSYLGEKGWGGGSLKGAKEVRRNAGEKAEPGATAYVPIRGWGLLLQ